VGDVHNSFVALGGELVVSSTAAPDDATIIANAWTEVDRLRALVDKMKVDVDTFKATSKLTYLGALATIYGANVGSVAKSQVAQNLLAASADTGTLASKFFSELSFVPDVLGPGQAPPPTTSPTVVGHFILPDGTYTQTNVSYNIGDDIRFSTIVPSTSSPVSIHGVVDGAAGNEFPWDVSATQYNYIIDRGAATQADVGSHEVWTVVKFADGTTGESNHIVRVVAAPLGVPLTPPPPTGPTTYTVTGIQPNGSPYQGTVVITPPNTIDGVIANLKSFGFTNLTHTP